MDTEDDGEMGLRPTYGPPTGIDPLPFWDPIVNQNLQYPGVLDNHLDMVHKVPAFCNGGFTGSSGLSDCHLNYDLLPNARKRRPSDCVPPSNASKNVESKDHLGVCSEQDEHNSSLRSKQGGKQVIKDNNSSSGEPPKENYVHVRAKRGQATNSHSLAERVRRERISERMRLLQELVPGCNKITGKAVMLDEIINYVQSLQQQVEFLSMKLATVNPEVNLDMERVLSKDILHTHGINSGALHGPPGQGFNSSLPFPGSGIPPGTYSSLPNTAPFHTLQQNVWENDVQNTLRMGFDSNSCMNNMGTKW
ncbi:unnamed protein product [Cuscuta europaea]|uniref:BHLH domain-containing protein n=1 Tax=Cuscuta europaea TaxID=41803 RepID=A0A9P1DWD9_CUSEU|nr:unnamed protein product [Cuscuta europaea]